ncbi:hypothetical protein [Deinococcus sp.]|uniref:hypothetical protein n=1 Tax=Deinococcus sp. TaxID=47478 RepID=UPI003CC59A6D
MTNPALDTAICTEPANGTCTRAAASQTVPYTRPTLTRLGGWNRLTLTISPPIRVGGYGVIYGGGQ